MKTIISIVFISVFAFSCQKDDLIVQSLYDLSGSPMEYEDSYATKFINIAAVSIKTSRNSEEKLGVMGQFNFVTLLDTETLPDYSINAYSGGVLLGISAYPVKFANGSKLGFYIDIYRGSQIYEDYYNQGTFEIPGSSFVKGGMRYRFN